jgi:hypothetical protein
MFKQLSLILAMVSSLSIAAVKTYQVTGPVLEVNGDMIVVQKGKDKWEIQKDAAVKGDVKVGDKVTVEYRMSAVSIEAKAKKK